MQSPFPRTLGSEAAHRGNLPRSPAAVEALTGPVIDRDAERKPTEREWDDLFAAAGSRPGRPELQRWLAQVRSLRPVCAGMELTSARNFLLQALKVLAVLPARDVPIAELAASALGDAHALDPDTSVGSLVFARGCDPRQLRTSSRTRSSRREAWASLGVICDELSAPVLVLNLPAAGETPPRRRSVPMPAPANPPLSDHSPTAQERLRFSRREDRAS